MSGEVLVEGSKSTYRKRQPLEALLNIKKVKMAYERIMLILELLQQRSDWELNKSRISVSLIHQITEG